MTPQEIWSTQAGVATEAMTWVGLNGAAVAAIGITNQRETTIVWDRETGKAIYSAIVWQDRRTAAFCDQLKARRLAENIRQKTGLLVDSYFSATKIRWILDNIEGARQLANQGRLAFGTVDTWLVWNMTRGQRYVTDISNASRTMLFNIHTMQWDDELLDIMGVPCSMLCRKCAHRARLMVIPKFPALVRKFPFLALLATSKRRYSARFVRSRAWSRIPTAQAAS